MTKSMTISLSNPDTGSSFGQETIEVQLDYKKDTTFLAKVEEFKKKASDHNFKMGTEDINDEVLVLIEAVNPQDRAFAETLEDFIY